MSKREVTVDLSPPEPSGPQPLVVASKTIPGIDDLLARIPDQAQRMTLDGPNPALPMHIVVDVHYGGIAVTLSDPWGATVWTVALGPEFEENKP